MSSLKFNEQLFIILFNSVMIVIVLGSSTHNFLMVSGIMISMKL